MPRFSFFTVLLGLLGLSLPWWPAAWLAWVPATALTWSLPGGIGLLLLGLVTGLRWSRRPAAGGGDTALRGLLTQRGLLLRGPATAWQAVGTWNGVELIVRRDEGFQAGRFGRVWVLILEVAGTARQPWPLLPTEAGLLTQDPHRCSVVLPTAASQPAIQIVDLIDSVVHQTLPSTL